MVVAIIALLVAIVIPAIGRVRDNARSTLCRSNLRQIGYAQYLFSSDNDDQYTEHFGISGELWQITLEPYISTSDRVSAKSVLSCPARLEETGNQASFGLNRFIDFPEWNFQVSAVQAPSEIFLAGDVQEGDNDLVFPSDTGPAWGQPGFRHLKGTHANMVFCDQHVESLDSASLVETNGNWKWF